MLKAKQQFPVGVYNHWLDTTMNKFVLIAVVGCSLGLLMQAVLSEGPFESAVQDEQRNDYPFRAETIDNNALEDELNDESAFEDQDEEDEDEVDDEEG